MPPWRAVPWGARQRELRLRAAVTPASRLWSDAINPYFCYIHSPLTLTPHLRVLLSLPGDDLAEVLNQEIARWPGYDVVELYDEYDRLLLRFTRQALITVQ